MSRGPFRRLSTYRDTWVLQHPGKATQWRPLLVAPKGGWGPRLRNPARQVTDKNRQVTDKKKTRNLSADYPARQVYPARHRLPCSASLPCSAQITLLGKLRTKKKRVICRQVTDKNRHFWKSWKTTAMAQKQCSLWAGQYAVKYLILAQLQHSKLKVKNHKHFLGRSRTLLSITDSPFRSYLN